MNFDVNWPRWCWASIAKHFKVYGDANSIPIFLEGMVRETDELAEWVEIRIDGPFTKEHSHGQWELRFEINLGIQVKETENAFRDKIIQGIFLEAMLSNICIYKLGESEFDDLSHIGSLTLLPRDKEKVIVSNFGRVNETVAMMQSSIEAHYQIKFD